MEVSIRSRREGGGNGRGRKSRRSLFDKTMWNHVPASCSGDKVIKYTKKKWKRWNILSIFKKGSKENALNYMPLSLKSKVCIKLEKIFKKGMDKYLQ